MKQYKSIFGKKRSLKEQLSFLKLYKHGDEEIMAMIENFIKKFNAPRTELYRAFATLFTTLAQEADMNEKEKAKKMNGNGN